METNAPNLLPLDKGRIVTFTDKGHRYEYSFGRIGAPEWARCFSGMTVETEQKKNSKGEDERVQHFDLASSGVRLVRELVSEVKGYRVSDDRSLMELPNWRDRLPLGHLQAVASMLQSVTESKDQVTFIDPDFDIVRLEATWSSFGSDKMAVFSGLTHFFTPMTVEHQARLMRARSQAIVVGGSRSGRTIYPTLNALYIDLYDQLVARVEGYSVAGTELNNVGMIRSHMDAWHKVAALTVLTKAPEIDEAA